LYVKLYCREEQQNEILTGPLRLLLDYFKQQTSCFFVRYHDPRPHLRLRFQGAPTFLTAEFFSVCVAWLQELIQQGLIAHFVFEGYEREIERYGGVQGMEVAEALFAIDSRLVLELLALPLLPDGVSGEEISARHHAWGRAALSIRELLDLFIADVPLGISVYPGKTKKTIQAMI
jgi:thiopeptide-type bacteriocin biosynthesis protein